MGTFLSRASSIEGHSADVQHTQQGVAAESCFQANLEGAGWDLDKDDYNQLCNLQMQMRMVDGSFWLNPRGPYKTLKDLWDVEE